MNTKRTDDTSGVIFILGAGASAPPGMPTTASLRDRLCDDTPWDERAAEIHRSGAYRFSAGLRRALAKHEFVLHYQPRVETVTGRITGMEALGKLAVYPG